MVVRFFGSQLGKVFGTSHSQPGTILAQLEILDVARANRAIVLTEGFYSIGANSVCCPGGCRQLQEKWSSTFCQKVNSSFSEVRLRPLYTPPARYRPKAQVSLHNASDYTAPTLRSTRMGRRCVSCRLQAFISKTLDFSFLEKSNFYFYGIQPARQHTPQS